MSITIVKVVAAELQTILAGIENCGVLYEVFYREIYSHKNFSLLLLLLNSSERRRYSLSKVQQFGITNLSWVWCWSEERISVLP